MKDKLLPILIVAVLIGVGLLAGSRLLANIEISAGKATQLRAEGDKAVLDAQASEIQAQTQRDNALNEQSLAVKQERDTQTTAMVSTLKKVGKLTGGGMMIALTILMAYFFGHRGWIVNDRLRRAPITAQRGSIVVTVLPGGDTTWHDLNQPGWMVSRSSQGVFAAHATDPQVLINAAQANAIRDALIHQAGLPRGQASRAVSDLREIMAPRGAGTRAMPEVVETS